MFTAGNSFLEGMISDNKNKEEIMEQMEVMRNEIKDDIHTFEKLHNNHEITNYSFYKDIINKINEKLNFVVFLKKKIIGQDKNSFQKEKSSDIIFEIKKVEEEKEVEIVEKEDTGENKHKEHKKHKKDKKDKK